MKKHRIYATIAVALLFGLMLLFASCGRIEDVQESDAESTSAHDRGDQDPAQDPKEDPTVTPSEEPDETSRDNGIDRFAGLPYKLSVKKHEDGNIKIRYPVLSGLEDKNREDRINEIIEKDAMQWEADYDAAADTLEVDFEIVWAGEALLSIRFNGYSNYNGAAHPSGFLFATNLYLPEASRIRLSDAVKISDYFAEFFVKNSHYAGPLDPNDGDLEEMLQEYIQAVDSAFLEKLDADEPGNEACFYFTPDSLGISIGVPHVIADYALYEISYEDILSYIFYENALWKDFPQVLSKIESSGNDSEYGNLQDFIPENYTIAQDYEGDAIKRGDLDKDGIDDLAFIVEGPATGDQAAPRILMVALGNGDNTYSLAVTANKAILKADEGGVMGDPLESIAISKGSLFLHFSGGSSWRWGYSYQFRYQDNDWYLIGATEDSYNINTSEETLTDYNLLTGDYIITQTDEDGKKSVEKGNCDKRYQYRLTDFDPRDGSVFAF